jgi:diaminopimelate epimerase
MKIAFDKYQGTGNDFIVLDNREGLMDGIEADLIGRLCHRKFGIGSDGLMLIQHHRDADFEMVFYNPDGSKSLCGNGSRCAVAYAKRLNMASGQGRFMTTDGMHAYHILPKGQVAIQMHNVSMPLTINGHPFLDTGSPHLVVAVEDVDAVEVVEEGRKLRNNDKFKHMGGTNVNFVAAMDGDSFGVRTYERGVENETLSCGTGVTAVALVLAASGQSKSPVVIHTHGGVLEVSFSMNDFGFGDVWLQGSAQHVFSGTIDA